MRRLGEVHSGRVDLLGGVGAVAEGEEGAVAVTVTRDCF